MIAGLAITGPKQVLARGAGPALTSFGVSGVLENPRLAFLTASTVDAYNDDWGNAASSPLLVAAFSQLGAFEFADDSLDSALLFDAEGGVHTIHVSGSDGGLGVGLVEIYDSNPSDLSVRPVSLSARAQVGEEDQILIVGFSIAGTAPTPVLIRGVGPGLLQFGVSGHLDDPVLTLLEGEAILATNDNWGSLAASPDLAAAFLATGAFDLPDGSDDAAILMSLLPGIYTAHLSGVDGAEGVGMVEVYVVPIP
jgi:hypothetical protein